MLIKGVANGEVRAEGRIGHCTTQPVAALVGEHKEKTIKKPESYTRDNSNQIFFRVRWTHPALGAVGIFAQGEPDSDRDIWAGEPGQISINWEML